MARIISIHNAKTHLSRIVDEVAKGSEVLIAKAGKPVVRLSPLTPLRREKRLGQLKGKIKVRDEFNAPLDEIATRFGGS